MDQKRLFLAIAISLAILLGFRLIFPPSAPPPHPATQTTAQSGTAPTAPQPAPGVAATPPEASAAPVPPPKEVPRVKIAAPRVQGTVSLLGARLDDLVLRDYRETLAADSPLVRLLEPRGEHEPNYVQFGWTAPAGSTIKLPDVNTTLWTASGNELTPGHPLTLAWDNGEGLTFRIVLAVDDEYMFTVQQQVANAAGQPVLLFPWARIRRDYTPKVAGYYVLHEGLLGWLDGRLQEKKYDDTKSEAEKHAGVAFESTAQGGWAGFTDKYWLTALVPDQGVEQVARFRYSGTGEGGYQVDFVPKDPEQIAPGATADLSTRVFVGAKEVHLLSRYETRDHIPNFSYAVDFGWFWFLTKPFFYCIDWLNSVFGNFGVAILVFTVIVKAVFFPLANKSYRSMSKMKLLAPKMQALRDQYKDDPAKLQQQMMALYKTEKVNPASGCLPLLIQIPVFFSLYKVIFVTIEMRQAPFFGWIRDLSVPDPTNVFNLFGVIPFDPASILPMLHLGAWPLLMGFTMYFQQKMNPPPPDPMQARIFQFMPIIFTFMLANFPAGLVIYWSWNNLLTIGQQWLIQRQTTLARPRMART
jgi:YidC/Oxa1 family membrane protein insertase